MNRTAGISDPWWLKYSFIAFAVGFLSLLLLLPLYEVFTQAFAKGWDYYVESLTDPIAIESIKLTLIAAGIAVPLNLVFGVVAAYCVAKFDFWGKSFLVSLIDLPFAISPVISGLIYVLIFGLQGWFGHVLAGAGIKIIFAIPGIVLATIFVTFPFVARELLPTMEAAGASEEEAALTLGASGWTMFFRVTLPKIKWALLYGVILTNARAMGEFGAVSVVSGHIRGKTNTLPLHAEALYNEYDLAGAFAVASLLSLLAVATIVLKKIVESRAEGETQSGAQRETKR